MNSPASIQLNNNGTLQDLFTVSDIVDFGSNSNGTYIKFSSGIILMYGVYNRGSLSDPVSIEVSYPYLSHYVSSKVTFSLPSTSIAGGSLSAGQNPDWTGTSNFWFTVGETSGTTGGIRFFSSGIYLIGEIHIQWIYAGRWK